MRENGRDEDDEGKVLQADNKFFLLSFYFILA
jgi:hypothetical protein